MVSRIRAFVESHQDPGERSRIAAELATLITAFLEKEEARASEQAATGKATAPR